jgi:hypothetical protein
MRNASVIPAKAGTHEKIEISCLLTRELNTGASNTLAMTTTGQYGGLLLNYSLGWK